VQWCRSLEGEQVSLGEAEVMESRLPAKPDWKSTEVRSGRFFKELELGPKLNHRGKTLRRRSAGSMLLINLTA
ncbi:hypothetical protein ATANTOWER_024009, partial [Ataeniobius toweri]|nr:hypothetical protein [Ataeniobius toweri]